MKIDLLKGRSVSVAVLLTTTFTSLLASSMLMLFFINNRIAETNLVHELTVYFKRHTESLGLMIQQDMLSGYYPAVIQKSVRFVENEDINYISIRLADNSKIFEKEFPAKSIGNPVKITIPILSNVTGLTDKNVDKTIGFIDVSVSFENIKQHMRQQQRRALILWCVWLLGTAIVILLMSRFIAKPVSRLRNLAASKDLNLIANYSPRSRIVELRALESEFIILSKQVLESNKAVKNSTRFEAIARTTQAMAHDVRKPFTMFKMIIDAVEGEDDPLEAKQLLKESLPEVQQAMASVNGMISDVLEIGSQSAPIMESTNPETLIESTLNEIFRVYPDAQVNITYSLSHKHKVNVDTIKIGRVFSNIVGNAVQAMGRKGSLWFKTEELEEEGKYFIRFCLGNGGSFIPAEHLAKLFEAFFTSGKKGGTGLGLAIAQKIINAHGGKIWCESDEQRGVEFFFTLPRDVQKTDTRPQPLPISSSQIITTFERLRGNSQTGSKAEINPLEVTLEKEVIKLVQAAKVPLRILVVDDEGVYRNSLAALVNRSVELKEHIHLSFAINSAQALEAAKAAPALVIQDVDLGKDSVNGYEVLKALRAQGFPGVVCIHSNRSLPEDYKVAVGAGADAVLPKPMSRTHFLKLMLQASERAQSQKLKQTESPVALPEFAILDDSKIILRAWKRKMADAAVVHAFESPDSFRSYAALHDGFLAGLKCVITDFYFEEGVLENGLMLADELRKQMTQPIFLCSDGEFTPEMVQGRVDKVISKDPVTWEKLLAHVESVKQ